MLGQIFFSLQKFVQNHLGPVVWSRLFAEAGIAAKLYMPAANYPDEEAVALIQAAGRLADRPIGELLETFGEALVPDLVSLYRSLIRPEWRTLELISNAEVVIHTAIRQRNPAASPPVLQCLRLSETDLQLVYSSSRQLCHLARGIIKGVAAHYKESVEITEHTCMLQGDSFCTMQVRIDSPAPARSDDLSTTLVHTLQPASGFRVGSNPWSVLSGSGTAARDAAQDAVSGGAMPRQVAQYRILDRLGAGGMGVVYLAEDGVLQRRIVVKLMLPEVATVVENRERFLREARAMAALTNDHIVPIYQVGQHDDQPFIAMPLLRGQTLEQRLEVRGPLPAPEVLRIGREIATGLAAAHEAGLIHRDIKPSNIWLEEPFGRVKILDFGLARGGFDAQAPRVTRAGVLIGTPHYMSPEQAAGELADGRSDLFSLGVILYQMCAGAVPFRGPSLISLLRSIAFETPRPLVEVVPGIPPDLSRLVDSLLAKAADDRPASAVAVAGELARLAAEPSG